MFKPFVEALTRGGHQIQRSTGICKKAAATQRCSSITHDNHKQPQRGRMVQHNGICCIGADDVLTTKNDIVKCAMPHDLSDRGEARKTSRLAQFPVHSTTDGSKDTPQTLRAIAAHPGISLRCNAFLLAYDMYIPYCTFPWTYFPMNFPPSGQVKIPSPCATPSRNQPSN